MTTVYAVQAALAWAVPGRRP